MIKFNKPVYAILNENTNELVAPFKTPYGVWFRSLYESERSVNIAFRKFNETIKELQENCKSKEDEEAIKQLYNLDKEFVFGKYKIVEINSVTLNIKI